MPTPPIICLVDKAPRPATTGNRVRIDRLVAELARSFPVELVIVGWPSEEDIEATRLAHGCDVTVIRPPAARPRPRDVVLWATGRGQVSRWLAQSADAARARVAERMASAQPAAVWVSGPWAAAVLPEKLPCPLLVDVDHLERVATRRELAVRSSRQRSPSALRQRARLRRDARIRTRDEATLWRRAQVLTATSDVEVAGLPAELRAKAMLVPNGVDVPDTSARAVGSHRMLLVGSFHYPPNADAARCMATSILPKVRAAFPEAAVDLVGAPTQEVERLSTLPGVCVHGFVPDIAALYAGSEIAVVPLRAGSGTKLKVLEAFAYGVPVVTTPIGVEGLDVRAGVHVSVAASEQELVEAVLRLFRDPAVAGAQAGAARAWVAERFSWESVGEAFRAAVQTVI